MERPAVPSARGRQGGLPARVLWALLLALLAPPAASAVEVEDTFRGLAFFQETFPSEKEAGEMLLEFNQEEFVHVDWDQKRNVWRLPEFTHYGYQTHCALANLAVLKESLEILMKRTNQTQAQNAHFVFQRIGDCSFQSNGSEAGSGPTPHVRFLDRFAFGRQEFVRFDSDRGEFEAVTTLGEPIARDWNSQKDLLEDARREVERFCRPSYETAERFASGRKIPPKLKITLSENSLAPNALLICTVDSFFPSKINISWFRNGKEEDESRVFTTDLIRNGDWTFQMAVMLEAQPERGDVYACQVEHASFPEPVTVRWEAQSKSARSKMWTGIVGIVMGVAFAAAGISFYLKSKKGQAIPQPAALIS
uniref:H-2 class II histocompatibility antigen, E-S beta chain-like n=1 Tax=Pogona vitticeps TaxID=103695 RepID=A0ABM5FF04_9SAUR